MTTAAPPEKMLEPCPFCGSADLSQGSDSDSGEVENMMVRIRCMNCDASGAAFQCLGSVLDAIKKARAAWNRREAARRLSAPANPYWYCKPCRTLHPTGTECPAPAAPRAGDGPPREPTETMLKAVEPWLDPENAIGFWQRMYDAALSAPPAASADEQEDDLDIDTRSWEEATTVDDLVAIIYSQTLRRRLPQARHRRE